VSPRLYLSRGDVDEVGSSGTPLQPLLTRHAVTGAGGYEAAVGRQLAVRRRVARGVDADALLHVGDVPGDLECQEHVRALGRVVHRRVSAGPVLRTGLDGHVSARLMDHHVRLQDAVLARSFGEREIPVRRRQVHMYRLDALPGEVVPEQHDPVLAGNHAPRDTEVPCYGLRCRRAGAEADQQSERECCHQRPRFAVHGSPLSRVTSE